MAGPLPASAPSQLQVSFGIAPLPTLELLHVHYARDRLDRAGDLR